MITKLTIRNFKSVRDLELDCRRVNILIGDAGAGRSNILEALGLLASTAHGHQRDLLRFGAIEDLFQDHRIDRPISVSVTREDGKGAKETIPFTFRYVRGRFEGTIGSRKGAKPTLVADRRGFLAWTKRPELAFVRPYAFPRTELPASPRPGPLTAPHGQNLATLVNRDDDVREHTVALLRRCGLEPRVMEDELGLVALKQVGGRTVALPWSAVSGAVRRYLFLLAAIGSNRGATLVLDRPEQGLFPGDAQVLGERLGFDRRNQCFVVTDSPYLFGSMVEKTMADELAVLVVHMREHETSVRRLSTKELSELLDMDPFYNFDKVIDDD
jgi:hypothetical protein